MDDSEQKSACASMLRARLQVAKDSLLQKMTTTKYGKMLAGKRVLKRMHSRNGT